MTEKEFHIFMKAQIQEILRICEGQNEYCDKWVNNHAKEFSKEWEQKLLNEKLAEYHTTIIEVHKIEEKIQSFFNLLAVRDNPRLDLCSDFGERVVQIIIPFDEINMSLLDLEKMTEVRNLVMKHRALRNNQKKLENEVNQFNAIENSIKVNMGLL